MNWYKTIKQASPIQWTEVPLSNIVEVGHRKDDDLIWWIDKSWQMHIGLAGAYGSHIDMPGYTTYEAGDLIAKGRYETPTRDHDGEVMALLSHTVRANQVDYVMKRVEKMLDDAFDNPVINFARLPHGWKHQ